MRCALPRASPGGPTTSAERASGPPPEGERLDLALVAAGHARSRTHARRIIEEGRALVDGRPARKPAMRLTEDSRIEVRDVPDGVEYASRAAHKLHGILQHLETQGAAVPVRGLRCLDAGASTGGFTDVLLRRGAAHVDAVDVGTGQLEPRLAADPRVTVHDGTSIRGLRPDQVGGAADLLVADLSFISLRTVLVDLAALLRPGGQGLLMVKPQFEVGRALLPRGGVVRDPAHRRSAVVEVVREAARQGLVLLAAGPSPLPGQDGNVELFVLVQREGPACEMPARAYDMIDQAMHQVAGHIAPTAPRTGRTREEHGA